MPFFSRARKSLFISAFLFFVVFGAASSSFNLLVFSHASLCLADLCFGYVSTRSISSFLSAEVSGLSSSAFSSSALSSACCHIRPLSSAASCRPSASATSGGVGSFRIVTKDLALIFLAKLVPISVV